MTLVIPIFLRYPRTEPSPRVLAIVSPASARLGAHAERLYFPELDAIRLFLFFGVWAYPALPLQDLFYIEHHFRHFSRPG